MNKDNNLIRGWGQSVRSISHIKCIVKYFFSEKIINAQVVKILPTASTASALSVPVSLSWLSSG